MLALKRTRAVMFKVLKNLRKKLFSSNDFTMASMLNSRRKFKWKLSLFFKKETKSTFVTPRKRRSNHFNYQSLHVDDHTSSVSSVIDVIKTLVQSFSQAMTPPTPTKTPALLFGRSSQNPLRVDLSLHHYSNDTIPTDSKSGWNPKCLPYD